MTPGANDWVTKRRRSLPKLLWNGGIVLGIYVLSANLTIPALLAVVPAVVACHIACWHRSVMELKRAMVSLSYSVGGALQFFLMVLFLGLSALPFIVVYRAASADLIRTLAMTAIMLIYSFSVFMSFLFWAPVSKTPN